jgi:hypothetical protein
MGTCTSLKGYEHANRESTHCINGKASTYQGESGFHAVYTHAFNYLERRISVVFVDNPNYTIEDGKLASKHGAATMAQGICKSLLQIVNQ